MLSLSARCEVGNGCRIARTLLTDAMKASSMCTWKQVSTTLYFCRSLSLKGEFGQYVVEVF